MLTLRDLHAHYPDSMRADATHALTHPTKKSAAGIIVLLLVAVGLYYMLPEIRRYIRLERM
jgi:hypothetical protein